MYDLTFVIGSGISTQLLLNSQLVDLIVRNGEVNIYLGQAFDDSVARPYIIMRHLYGGEENKTEPNSFDVVWLVYAVADNQADAQLLAGLIKTQLTNQKLTLVDNWNNWAGVTTTSIYSVVENNQNVQRYKVGEYYRIRAVENT